MLNNQSIWRDDHSAYPNGAYPKTNLMFFFTRCEKLVAQNNLLRDQLEESHHLNEALTGDLQKLTNDWEALRDEMAVKEDEWKDEEQVWLIQVMLLRTNIIFLVIIHY